MAAIKAAAATAAMAGTPYLPAAPSVVVWYAVYVVPSAVHVVASVQVVVGLLDVQPVFVFDVQLDQPLILVPQHVV